MRPRRPDTLVLELPNSERVRVWRRDAEAIQSDYWLTGNVFLVRDPGTEIYSRVDPASIEAAALTPHARRVTG